MPDVHIKTPNFDDIFEKWKNSTIRKQKKKMEKEFGTKGSVFSSKTISAAETVRDTMKEAAIYFAIEKRIAPIKGKEQGDLIIAPRLPRETFYSFKGGKVNKDNWRGKDKVPNFESIRGVQCKTCKGKGYIENRCKICKGKGKIDNNMIVLMGENQDKEKKIFSYTCGECFGTGNLEERCKECGGHKNLYTFDLLPVPFKTVITGDPVLHSSGGSKYEKEMAQDLHKLIKDVEGIRFSDFKTLEQKAEAFLGYWNKEIKKTISLARSDYAKTEKNPNLHISTEIYLFPMIQMFCETKRGTSFDIFSIGSANKFITYSNF